MESKNGINRYVEDRWTYTWDKEEALRFPSFDMAIKYRIANGFSEKFIPFELPI